MFAGYWYPADPEALSRLIAAAPEKGPEVRCAILPHAGLFFSHRGIGHYLSRLEEGITRVIILSPSHYAYLSPNEILGSKLLDSAATPFGSLRMSPLEGVSFGGEAQIQREHAVEMVLPGLKQHVPGANVSMGLISQVDEEHVETLAGNLLRQADEHTSLIASSDFTHYGEGFSHTPYGTVIDESVRSKVHDEDTELAGLLAAGDWKEALRFSNRHHSTVCGIAPNVIVSCMCKHLGLVGEVADAYDSWDLSGGGDSFVSYVTVLWRKP